MTEGDFWLTLEYRLSRELKTLGEKCLRFLGCDGFVPDDHQPDDEAIVGDAWTLAPTSRPPRTDDPSRLAPTRFGGV
jgi:hypothetical protein